MAYDVNPDIDAMCRAAAREAVEAAAARARGGLSVLVATCPAPTPAEIRDRDERFIADTRAKMEAAGISVSHRAHSGRRPPLGDHVDMTIKDRRIVRLKPGVQPKPRPKTKIILELEPYPPEPPPRTCVLCGQERPAWFFNSTDSNSATQICHGPECSGAFGVHGRSFPVGMGWKDYCVIQDAHSVIRRIEREAKGGRQCS